MTRAPLAPVFALLAAAGVGTALLGIYVRRRRTEPGTAAFAAFCWLLGGTGVVAAAYGTAAMAGALAPAPGAQPEYLWYQLLNALVALLAVPWVSFTVRYTGHTRDIDLSRARETLLSLPVVGFALMVWFAVFSNGLGVEYGVYADAALNGAYVLLGFYTVAMNFAAVAFLAYAAASSDHLPTAQGASLGAMAAAPLPAVWVGGSMLGGHPPASPLPGVAVVTAGFWVAAGGGVLGVVRYDALRTTPALGNVGRETLIEEMDDLVMVVDRDGVVTEINPAAEAALDADPAVGRPVADLLGAPVSDLRDGESVELSTVEGRRRFDPAVTRLGDGGDRSYGHLVTLRDVTAREIREQRLAVLNRVLRHNLRNKLSIVKGTADTIAAGNESPELAADRLGRAADDLMQLGEKARRIERLMRGDEPEGIPVRVETVVEEVVESVAREHPAATFETDVPADLSVEGSEGLVRYALGNLVENAAEHNDAADPTVRVTVETRGENDRVRITVADNGPGIPEDERAVIRDGDETPLVHGSGIGLWAANWCATRLGGDLSFESVGPDGTTVRIDLPPTAPFVTDPVDGPAADAAPAALD